MPPEVGALFDEWAAALARGERPDPREFIARAGAAADELGRLMDAFLVAGPRREPDEETVALARAWVAGESPLVELRARRGLRPDDLVEEVMSTFAIDKAKRPKVTRYLDELEAGTLDPSALDKRLLNLLAKALRTTAQTILDWRPRPLEAAPSAEAPAVAFSAADVGIALTLEDVAAVLSETQAEPDDVDQLFGQL